MENLNPYKNELAKLSRWHHIIEVFVVSLISFVSFEALISVTNLYQPKIYIELSFAIYIILLFWMFFIFDIYFRSRDVLILSYSRFSHFFSWNNIRYFQNYVILPAAVYWGTVILIGINFGHRGLQQTLTVCSSLALICNYSFFHKIFGARIKGDNELQFIILTYVKMYASWVLYAGILGITWYYCYPSHVYYLAIFTITLILLYQALFQFHADTFRNVIPSLSIALVITAVSVFVYSFWNVNYFTAGLLLTAIYNFCWNILLHRIKKTLTPEVFVEQLAFLLLLLVMVFGVTNFKERIDRC